MAHGLSLKLAQIRAPRWRPSSREEKKRTLKSWVKRWKKEGKHELVAEARRRVGRKIA